MAFVCCESLCRCSPCLAMGREVAGRRCGRAGEALGVDVGLYHTPQEANGVVCVGLLWQVGVGRSVRFEPIGALAAVGHEGYAQGAGVLHFVHHNLSHAGELVEGYAEVEFVVHL